ncbi:unnamed protein product [Prorocentrum cordatum]|uniref:Uncharacterized protein n=1 Tax=Prorocentrum cordatum TaxID=2364126 RepID=A0ABN9P9I2_9DINO|nr:unnamed protein product [Polarella glacialis]
MLHDGVHPFGSGPRADAAARDAAAGTSWAGGASDEISAAVRAGGDADAGMAVAGALAREAQVIDKGDGDGIDLDMDVLGDHDSQDQPEHFRVLQEKQEDRTGTTTTSMPASACSTDPATSCMR